VRIQRVVAVELPGFAMELLVPLLRDMVIVPPEAMP
jgi:hypothetical protein